MQITTLYVKGSSILVILYNGYFKKCQGKKVKGFNNNNEGR